MDYERMAVLCLVVGILLVPLGLFITPGGHELAECRTHSGGGFEGIEFPYLTWNDGCNDHFISLVTVFGGLSVVAAAGFGGVSLTRRYR